MRQEERRHWLLARVAERLAPAASIDLWPRVDAQLVQAEAHRMRAGHRRTTMAAGLALAVLLVGSLALVPGVRAFAADLIQRMGIALVESAPLEEGAESQVLEATPVAVRVPSLTVQEARDQAGFAVQLPTWLPASLGEARASLFEPTGPGNEGYGIKLSITYTRQGPADPGEGLLVVHAAQGLLSAPPVLPAAAEQPVTVRGLPGVYVHGGWQSDGSGDPRIRMGDLLWDAAADDAYLTWVEEGVTYLLEAHGLGLTLDDLLQVAASME